MKQKKPNKPPQRNAGSRPIIEAFIRFHAPSFFGPRG
jgi:hypothetical protein